jgi:hypothetical protein
LGEAWGVEHSNWRVAFLTELARDASIIADEFRLYTMLTVTKDRKQATRWPARELLYRDLMDFWTSQGGGEPAYSWGPRGPLVDFLTAVLSGLPDGPESGAMAGIIDRYKERLARPSLQAPSMPREES